MSTKQIGVRAGRAGWSGRNRQLFSSRLLHGHAGHHHHPAALFQSRPGLVRGLGESRLYSASHQVVMHGVPTMARQISFARAVPKLVSKFATLGAVGGGAVVAGVSYVQYQATQASNFVIDIFSVARDTSTEVASDIYDTADRVFSSLEIPGWLRDGFSNLTANNTSDGSGRAGGGGDGQQSSGPDPSGQKPQMNAGYGAAVAGAAVGLSQQEESARDDQMMVLTKKMIQIRRLLQTVDHKNPLTLPSIVVIGSQSSGKSSVLESIVGHEFLPKGSNMVTRRPIELTLVNTPDSTTEYAEFPALGMSKITDFSQVQRTLVDLNMSVPADECVSDDPIELRVYSANVPDLSLIDLPGYIQVVGRGQPVELKEKIAQLCDKYIREPNVILAISAADVDLANSTALRASRRVDPRGERTIGVVTKMDLVDPERGSEILSDPKYALRLGYVGVVTRLPASPAVNIFNRSNSNIAAAVQKNEHAFFSAHPESFGPDVAVDTGTRTLKSKLISVLERTMASSLKTVSTAVQQDLAEATYEFKVQYNDRPISAESYIAESLDGFKHAFRSFADSFGRPQVRQLIMHELEQQVLNLLAQRYWNKPIEDLTPTEPDPYSLKDLPKADPEDPLWHLKLDSSSSSLTKLGIGRLATSEVASALQSHVEHLVSTSSFASHPIAKQTIAEASAVILRDLSYDISDELEICLKPYKYRIDLSDADWALARENVGKVLQDELRVCQSAIKRVEEAVGGRRRLKDVLNYIQRVRSGQVILENNGVGGAGGFSASLLKQGQEAAFLQERCDTVQLRLMAIKARQCSTKQNKYFCPEIFLEAVADKLTTTADLFLDAELLSKFYYSFPRELDSRLGRNLSASEADRLARENERVRRHIDLVRRKDLLEQVLSEIEDLRRLEARGKRRAAARLSSSSSPSSGLGGSGSRFGTANVGSNLDEDDDYDDVAAAAVAGRKKRGWRLI